MLNNMNKPTIGLTLLMTVCLAGCEPEVGSDAWCENMEEQPAGDWSINQAADYAKHCLVKSDES